MKTNPEFLRNVWLELTPHRIVGMPAALVAVFFLVYLLADINYLDPLRTTAMVIFFLLTLLWGTRLAGEALVNEVQDKTWDQQRMSSISPWSMSWGKLFGSTVYTWYGAAICLLMYIFAAFKLHQPEVITTVLFMVVVSVFSQSIALLTSLQTVKTYNRSASTGFMMAGILVSIPLLNLGLRDLGMVHWYDNYYRTFNFSLVSIACFTGWSLLGIHRRIRQELQFRNTPAYWFAFCVFTAFFLAGFASTSAFSEGVITARLLVAYLTFVLLAYGMMMAEDKNPVLIRRITAALQVRNWQNVFENTPAWLVTLLGVYALSLVLLVHNPTLTKFFPETLGIRSVVIAVALFLTRDILIFVFFNISSNRRRADVTAVFYLMMLYWLLPSILNALNLSSLNAVFLPFGPHNEMVSIVAAVIQVAVLLYLSIRRWGKLYTIKKN